MVGSNHNSSYYIETEFFGSHVDFHIPDDKPDFISIPVKILPQTLKFSNPPNIKLTISERENLILFDGSLYTLRRRALFHGEFSPWEGISPNSLTFKTKIELFSTSNSILTPSLLDVSILVPKNIFPTIGHPSELHIDSKIKHEGLRVAFTAADNASKLLRKINYSKSLENDLVVDREERRHKMEFPDCGSSKILRMFAKTEYGAFLPLTSHVTPIETLGFTDNDIPFYSISQILEFINSLPVGSQNTASDGLPFTWRSFTSCSHAQSWHDHEKAAMLCSILLGQGRDAWVYAGLDGDEQVRWGVFSFDPKYSNMVMQSKTTSMNLYNLSKERVFDVVGSFKGGVFNESEKMKFEFVFNHLQFKAWIGLPSSNSRTRAACLHDLQSTSRMDENLQKSGLLALRSLKADWFEFPILFSAQACLRPAGWSSPEMEQVAQFASESQLSRISVSQLKEELCKLFLGSDGYVAKDNEVKLRAYCEILQKFAIFTGSPPIFTSSFVFRKNNILLESLIHLPEPVLENQVATWIGIFNIAERIPFANSLEGLLRTYRDNDLNGEKETEMAIRRWLGFPKSPRSFGHIAMQMNSEDFPGIDGDLKTAGVDLSYAYIAGARVWKHKNTIGVLVGWIK